MLNLFLLGSSVWNSFPGLLGAIETEIISRLSRRFVCLSFCLIPKVFVPCIRLSVFLYYSNYISFNPSIHLSFYRSVLYVVQSLSLYFPFLISHFNLFLSLLSSVYQKQSLSTSLSICLSLKNSRSPSLRRFNQA
jgi:hypothetical protein